MSAGYFVIRVPSGFDVRRMIFNPRMGLFTCNGRHNRLMTEFIEDDSIGMDSDSEYLGSILSEYDEELRRLRGELNEKILTNSTLENQLAEERASANETQRKLMVMDLTNKDLTERLSRDKGWSIGIKKEQTKTVAELLSKMGEYERLLEQSRQSNLKLSKKLDQALENNDRLTAEQQALKKKLEGIRELYEKNIRETNGLKADYKDQREKISALTHNIEDLERTNRHLRNEKNDMLKVDFRGIVSGFLQYTTDVHNAILDKQDSDLKQYLQMKTDYLIVNLKGIGLEIVHHTRGCDLSDARVDIQPVDTTNPELNGKVKMSDRFGCKFSSSNYPEIPESVTVYALKAGNPEGTLKTNGYSDSKPGEVSEDKEVKQDGN